jgi:phosphate transport system permease protein
VFELGRDATRGDLAVQSLSWAMALAVVGLFGWMIFHIAAAGLDAIDLTFLTSAPSDAGRAGGIAPILVSTLLILCVCLVVAVPLGLTTAVYLAEYATDTALIRWIRRAIDLLAGVPSIICGLFGNAFFCVYLGLGFSIASGGLTLACMALPLLVHTFEAGLRAVPAELRSAGAALGWSHFTVLRHLVLPAAAPALLAGLVLGVGRALAETAALIFTAGYVDRMPDSLLDSGRSLSLHIYDLAMNVPGGDRAANGSALVLIVLTLTINLLFAALQARMLPTCERATR